MERDIIGKEVEKLLHKGIITVSKECVGDFYSNLFIREKKDGSFRTILNLKKLNQKCDKFHFKMETIKQVIHMIRPNMFLASLDIKDAFYSIGIHPGDKKFLKFMWNGQIYEFRQCQTDMAKSCAHSPKFSKFHFHV